MPRLSQSPACSVQPTEQVTPPRAGHTPRRMLRSRQGNAGVVVNIGEGSTSFIVALGQASDAYSVSKCKDKRCMTCTTLVLSNIVTSIYYIPMCLEMYA